MEKDEQIVNNEINSKNTDDSLTIASISGEINLVEKLDPEVEEQLSTIAGNIDSVDARDADNREILPDEIVKDKLEEVAKKTAPSKNGTRNTSCRLDWYLELET